MCGIAGILFKTRGHLDADLISRIFKTMGHRGPDDQGWLTYDGVNCKKGREPRSIANTQLALFHSRLSIIDLSDSGHQPMLSDDGRFVIVFNGEIYNYIELRQELISLGCLFHSQTDTEVLLNVYRYWGVEGIKRCEGMFAFALLDLQENRLVLFRDFFGIKPLYYFIDDEKICFASEIKTLLEISKQRRQVNPQRLFDYLRFNLTDCGSETLFKNIYQLPSAHYLNINLTDINKITPVRYWKPTISEDHQTSFHAAAAQLRELFLSNVKKHLRSDVRVGAALSGGIDSSAIVSAIRHLEPDAEINTFSFIPEDASISEEKWIDLIADFARTKSHKVICNPLSLFNDLDELIKTHDEPFGSTSIFAQYQVFKKAKEQGVQVMLDGQGADEILAGYHNYLPMRAVSFMRDKRYLKALQYIISTSQALGLSKVNLGVEALGHFAPESLQNIGRKLIGRSSMPVWLNAKWFQERDVVPPVLHNIKDKYALKESLRRSVGDVGLSHLLRYEDRDSMAFSIESRVPFLTPALVNFMLSMPESYIIDEKGTTKLLFREAMQGIVPESILQRKDKIGFATPEQRWLIAEESKVNAILSNCTFLRDDGPINFKYAKRQWRKTSAGGKYLSNSIWRLVNFLMWAELYDVQF